jgi:hypothetical protein
MTPFVYPLNPFLGWNIGGDPTKPITGNMENTAEYAGVDNQPGNADDTVVWGAERPEMIITQTLAWHDRRTDDTTFEDVYPPLEGPGKTTKDTKDPDDDFDQLTRPRPAGFITLYNPWAPEPGASADTHSIKFANVNGSQQAFDMGVDLQRTHNGEPDGSPVCASLSINATAWLSPTHDRTYAPKAYTVEQANEWDPDDPDPAKRPPFPIDRAIYFTSRDPGYPDDGTAFFADPSKTNGADPITGNPRLANVGTVRPGRYLIVGGGKQLQPGTGIYETIIADTKGASGRNPTAATPRRRINWSRRTTRTRCTQGYRRSSD